MPLIAGVDLHQVVATVKPYRDMPALFFSHNAAHLENTGDWYLNFEYAIERERGLDYSEDLFNPIVMRFDLHRETTAVVIA